MKIDVTPIIREANKIEKLIMDLYEYPAMYVVEASNGWQVTVQFSPEKLKGFLPNKNVSEMLEAWAKSIEREFKFWTRGAKTGKHPRYKHTIHHDDGTVTYKPWTLSEWDIKRFQKKADVEQAKLGKLSFIKIV